MSPPREMYRLTLDMENDDTNRRIAEFRRNLQTYEEMSSQNRTSDPDSGYRTATPEPTAFIADPDSPHLAPSSHLHPNVTTRGHKRSGRRFSDLFTISHRGRNTPTPTFDQDNRPKISRPIVDQGYIEVPHNGPYIYNHPSRPRLDVEIPRSSFSDLWGQRYGPIGDAGYNVDAVQHDVRNTQSVDFGRLVGGRENYRHDTRRHGVSLGGIADWNTLVATTSTTGSMVDSDNGENAEEDDDMDASYLAPLVSPTLHSPSSSITTASASLPSISNLPPLPLSASDLPPLPPSTVALDEGNDSTPTPEEDHTRSPSPLTREPSERWIRHPLRQNPPTRTFLPPPPPPPPSSPILFPSTPSPATHWPSLQHFRPSCGVLIANVGNTAMVQPFIVTPDYDDDQMSFARSEGSIVQVREDTPPPVARRLFGSGASASASASAAPPAAQSHQRRSSHGLRSLCCGLFPRRHRQHTTASLSTAPSTQHFAPMTQRVPIAHTTIPEEDEDEEENNDQENEPPTIVETLIQSDEHDDEHDNDISRQADREADQEMVEEHEVGRRRSVRHSWVTVSRWLE
ncbi:hypothetical protein E4T44_08492 [Aureobasidium sp. EXF-8845]|nr:hypothetical protein E4T44_08492 [Aureobasidium sp. EXF-8845]KAI4855028.1 hypothetical protein E4T45_03540 [Aureobasidium sp. EXF-8846]